MYQAEGAAEWQRIVSNQPTNQPINQLTNQRPEKQFNNFYLKK